MNPSSFADPCVQLKSKATNFVFLFGSKGVGKSSIVASLISYMETDYKVGALTTAGHTSADSANLYRKLKNDINNGIFPTRSAIGVVRELGLVYTPLDSTRPKMKFTFLEMSGEDLEKIELREDSYGELPDHIDAYLECKGLPLVFLLIIDCTNIEKDAMLVDQFLDYIRIKNVALGKTKIILVLSKWDTVPHEYQNRVEDFVQKYMRGIHNRFNHDFMKKPDTFRRITHFSLGEDIITRKDKSGVEFSQVLGEIDYSKAQTLTSLIYEAICGMPLHKAVGFWESIWLKIDEIISWFLGK